MSEESVEAAERRMDIAADKVKRLASINAPFGLRRAAEIQYGEAYQVLVRLGVRQQIRGKYRG